MGVIFEAENRDTGKRVAIKWIRPDVGMRARARLPLEARAASRVCHPHVVNVFDVCTEGSALFLVMELLEGETLRRALDRGEQPLPAMIALLCDAGLGVGAAHAAGIVHRDLKPENIFLAREPARARPVAKILDFGVSRMLDGTFTRLTQTGTAVGTLSYMPYEQLEGRRQVDQRADVYAMGVILYELITGRVPFQGRTPAMVALQLVNEKPRPIRELRPEVPEALDRLVLWALARDASERVPSMQALLDELAPFATERGFRAQLGSADEDLPRVPPGRAGKQPAGRAGSEPFGLSDPRARAPRRTTLALGLACALVGAAAWSLASSQTRSAVQAGAIVRGDASTASARPLRSPAVGDAPLREAADVHRSVHAMHAEAGNASDAGAAPGDARAKPSRRRSTPARPTSTFVSGASGASERTTAEAVGRPASALPVAPPADAGPTPERVEGLRTTLRRSEFEEMP